MASGPDVSWNRSAQEAGEVSTTVFALDCHYGTEIRHVGNDAAVLKGILVSALLGAAAGPLLALYLELRARQRRRHRSD